MIFIIEGFQTIIFIIIYPTSPLLSYPQRFGRVSSGLLQMFLVKLGSLRLLLNSRVLFALIPLTITKY